MARVTRAFVDARDNRRYGVGDKFAGTARQVQNLARRGFVEAPAARAGYEGMTVARLRALLADRGVEVPAKARKAELAAMLEEGE